MIAFANPYMTFDHLTEPYQRADDVGYAISEFLWFEGRPFYPVSALTQAKISRVNLSAPRNIRDDEDNHDLIFRMPKADGGHFFEIVLRSDEGTIYGGWAWGEELECLDQIKDGYRVLSARFSERQLTFAYSVRIKAYCPTCDLPVSKMG